MYPCPKCGCWTYVLKTDTIKCQQCREIIKEVDSKFYKVLEEALHSEKEE